jgi:hypothetical protein
MDKTELVIDAVKICSFFQTEGLVFRTSSCRKTELMYRMAKGRIYMEVMELNFSFRWPVMSQLIF